MPPLITLVIAGVSAYAGYRYLSAKGARVAKGLRRAREELKRSATGKPVEKNLGDLSRDPNTGEYKPGQTPPNRNAHHDDDKRKHKDAG